MQGISMSNTMQRRQFSVLACVFQSIFVALFAIFGEFHNHEEDKHNRVHANYPMFQDIHTMINDAGRSLVVHCFGAYFGLAAAKVCHRQNTMVVDDDESSGHSSELFAMLAKAACTTATFMLSSLADHLGRFNMAHIQSSSLAGGIAIGAFANVILYPHHAIVVGAAAALISVVGHPKILEKRLSIQDTCGAHSLHGLPSLLAGFLSALFVLLYEPSEYGPNFVEQYSAIYPQWKGSGQPGAHRDLRTQSFFQLAGLGLTFLTAIFGGLFCGWVMNWSLLNQVQPKPSYEDASYYLNAEFSLFGNIDNSGHGLGSSNTSIHKCGRIDYRPLDIEAALRAVKRAGIGPDAIF
uniref:Ammonium transporter AmtB-like domain-containing protein n=1 Tax=Meloidogyne javanica TaxID=6303 RepID=A0A915MG26_MELJA